MSRMVAVSLLAHAMFLSVLVLLPSEWRSGSVAPETAPMMITLQSGSGPEAGGMTPLSGRPVQVEAPPDVKPKAEPPPAPKAPEMVAPEPAAKPLPKTPPKAIEKPVDKSSSRKPTSGPAIKAGDARADTGAAPVPFGGLTQPSGGGLSQGATTDYANFCCPAYLKQMTDMIQRNWNPNQGVTGVVKVKFTIARDGALSNVEVEKPSNISTLDLESQRAILKTQQLPALPREFTESTLTVHLNFQYQR